MSILWDTSEDDLPEEEGCVRMICPIGGFHVFPNPSDPTKSIVRMVIEADLKGNIPGWIMKQALTLTSMGLTKV